MALAKGEAERGALTMHFRRCHYWSMSAHIDIWSTLKTYEVRRDDDGIRPDTGARVGVKVGPNVRPKSAFVGVEGPGLGGVAMP